jgi:hypothetical protein
MNKCAKGLGPGLFGGYGYPSHCTLVSSSVPLRYITPVINPCNKHELREANGQYVPYWCSQSELTCTVTEVSHETVLGGDTIELTRAIRVF